MRVRSRSATAAVACAALALTAPALESSASVPQATVVEQVPAPEVAQLESTARVPRPRVDALESHRGLVFVGGRFRRLADGAGTHRRRNIAVLSAETGQVLDIPIEADGTVLALAARGRFLYLGGTFSQVNGRHRPYLAKVDAGTGEVVRDFKPALDGPVREIDTVSKRLFVAGAFSGVLMSMSKRSGRPTGYLRVPISGQLRPEAGPTSVNRFAVNPARTRLLAVGNFTDVGGQERKRAFMLALGQRRARLGAWYYPPLAKRCRVKYNTKVASLTDADFSPDGRWFVLSATGGTYRQPEDLGYQVCDAVARFETGDPSPTRPTWVNYTGGDTVWTVQATGAAVYAEGHFRWVNNPLARGTAGPGAVDRRGLAALDPVTGQPLAWHPAMPSVRGGRALVATPQGLWAGSDALKVGGQPRHGLAFFPLPAQQPTDPS